LSYHCRFHAGEKPYSCGDYGKSFVHSCAPICHCHLHTRVKPYSCGDCGKSFSNITDLKIHHRTHTGE
ncbi:ZN879 protein, partial [Ramphastos sulfuratus]|nr:ZN879 protein [Ramphastos sulfuratus]